MMPAVSVPPALQSLVVVSQQEVQAIYRLTSYKALRRAQLRGDVPEADLVRPMRWYQSTLEAHQRAKATAPAFGARRRRAS